MAWSGWSFNDRLGRDGVDGGRAAARQGHAVAVIYILLYKAIIDSFCWHGLMGA